MKKAILTLLLMIAAMTSATAYDFEVDGIYYNINSTKATVTYKSIGYYSGEITIPETVTYHEVTYPVTCLGHLAFASCHELTNVIIPNSVTQIESQVFQFSEKLQNIIIPDSVTRIGLLAFQGCKGLTSINIPKKVSMQHYYPLFSGCANLTTITVDSDNPYFDSRDNCNAIIETATNTLLEGCKNTTIPGTVTSISDNAFERCTGLTNIIIPNSVTTIGSRAFYNCTGLKSINFPESVTSIGAEAFASCYELADLTFPKSLKNISSGAFNYCLSLSNLTIPKTLTTMGTNPFGDCSGIESIMVEDGNPNYDSRDDCNAIIETATNTLISSCENTIIPITVTTIGEEAFLAYPLSSVTIPNTVTTIGKRAFMMSELSTVDFPNSVTTIDDGAFSYCTNLYYLKIGDFVTYIGDEAFVECEWVKNIVIPASVTHVGQYAFVIRSLKSVICNATTPPTSGYDYPFSYDNYEDAILYVPEESIPAYQEDFYWGAFANIRASGDYTPGDTDGDGVLTISDVTMLINYLATDNDGGIILDAADVNGDGVVNISDVTALINLLIGNQP